MEKIGTSEDTRDGHEETKRKCYALSAQNLYCEFYTHTQCCLKDLAMSSATVARYRMILAIFEKRLVMNSNAVLLLCDSMSVPRILKLKYVSGSRAGNIFKFRCVSEKCNATSSAVEASVHNVIRIHAHGWPENMHVLVVEHVSPSRMFSILRVDRLIGSVLQ